MEKIGIKEPTAKYELDTLTTSLDALLDIVGGNESYPLMKEVDALSNLIAFYEKKRYSCITD